MTWLEFVDEMEKAQQENRKVTLRSCGFIQTLTAIPAVHSESGILIGNTPPVVQVVMQDLSQYSRLSFILEDYARLREGRSCPCGGDYSKHIVEVPKER